MPKNIPDCPVFPKVTVFGYTVTITPSGVGGPIDTIVRWMSAGDPPRQWLPELRLPDHTVVTSHDEEDDDGDVTSYPRWPDDPTRRYGEWSPDAVAAYAADLPPAEAADYAVYVAEVAEHRRLRQMYAAAQAAADAYWDAVRASRREAVTREVARQLAAWQDDKAAV